MDRERFDELTRAFGIQTTRRGALGLLAGLTGLHLTGADAKRRRGGKARSKPRRQANGRVGSEAAENACARLCEQVFPRPGRARNRCLQRAVDNQTICECPGFCRRLYPGNARQQLACLRAALEERPDSLCRQCGADPDRACEQADGSHICCASASDVCGEGSCAGNGGDGGDGGDGGGGGGCASSCPTLDALRPCGALDRSGCGLPPLECGTCGADETCQQIGICGRFCCPPQGCSFSGPNGSDPCFPGCVGAGCGGADPGQGGGGPGGGTGGGGEGSGSGCGGGPCGGTGTAGPAPAP